MWWPNSALPEGREIMTKEWIDRATATFVASTALVVILACDGASSGGSANSTGSGTASAEPAIKVDAATIIADYQANEVAGDNKYKDKIVEVTGVVDHIGKGLMDDVYVSIGTGKEFELSGVQCSVTKDMEGKAASLTKGQSLTVKGKVTGLMMSVQLQDCSF